MGDWGEHGANTGGYYKCNKFDSSGILNSGQTYVSVVLLPTDGEDVEDDNEAGKGAFTEDFEDLALDRMLALQAKWDADGGNPNNFRVEIISERSFEDEFTRSVTEDLPLLPIVFLLMSVLCIIIFSRRDAVLSRSWLGFGAVVTVLLAIMASFGLLFAIGVPFTSLTPVRAAEISVLLPCIFASCVPLIHCPPFAPVSTALALHHVWCRTG